MAILTRTVRFCLSRSGSPLSLPRSNTHAGWPPMIGLGAYWEITVQLEGEPDPRTGYVLRIDYVDTAVREHVIPWLLDLWENSPGDSPTHLLPGIHQRISEALPTEIYSVSLKPEPMSTFLLETATMTTISIARRYEFSAAHRLAISTLSDEENMEIYGKCSNPNGHGHNYEIEVMVDVPLPEAPLNPTELDALVDRIVIDRFDHQNLDKDLEDFQDTMTSVEHLTARCAELLKEPIADTGATLRHVTMWETPRTSCTIQNDDR